MAAGGHPIDQMFARLHAVRETGPGRWMARCPAHDDRTPSLSIRETEGGVLLIHCFAQCAPIDVLAAVGLELADLFPDGTAWKHRRPRIAVRDIEHARILCEVAVAEHEAGRELSEGDRRALQGAVETLRAARRGS